MDYTLFASDQSLHTSISPLSIPYSRQNPALIGLNPPPDVTSNRCGELFTPEVQADHLNCVMESQTPYPPSPERSLIMPNIITGGDVEFQPMPYREVATPIPIITPRVVPSPIIYPVDQQLPSPVNFAPVDLWDLVKNTPEASYAPTTRTLGPEVATNTGGVGTMHDFLIGSKVEAAGPVASTVQQPSTSWLPLIMIAIAVFK